MGDTAISWTMGDDGTPGKTWNPIRGCSKVSPGCTNCYAERVAVRFCGEGQPYEGLAERRAGGRWTGEVRLIPEHLADPLRWRKPRRIFVNSMSDLFHEKLTNEEIAAVFGVMAAAPQHTFQILTKRAGRMREWFEWVKSARPPYAGLPSYPDHRHERCVVCRCAWMVPGYDINGRDAIGLHPSDEVLEHQGGPWPLPNVWLGVSVENQAAADERIPLLLQTPAAVRFLSCEPLLGPVNLRHLDAESAGHAEMICVDSLTGRQTDMGRPCRDVARIDWVITGCESGPGARPCDVAWLRSLRDQCAAAGVPFWLKQAVEVRTGIMAPASAPPEIIKAVSPFDRTRFTDAMTAGPGSKRKAGGVIELPYLDGIRHAAFPVNRG